MVTPPVVALTLDDATLDWLSDKFADRLVDRLKATADRQSPYMNSAEACAYLRLSESALYRLTARGRLPGNKVRGEWLFNRDRLDRWVASDCAVDDV